MADCITSIVVMLQGPLLPEETLFPIAIGNARTCEVVGFFFMASLASAVYNCALTLYFLVMVRCGWTENKAKKSFLPWIHCLAVVSVLSFGVAGLTTQSFNPNIIIVTCGFAPSPGNCLSDDNVPCQRGEMAGLLFRLFNSILISLSLCSIACLWLLYVFVNGQTRRNRRFDFAQHQQRSGAPAVESQVNKRDRAVLVQACCYTVASLNIFLTVGIALIYRNIVLEASDFDLFRMYDSTHYFLFRLGITVFFPLQGFFNWVIFVRPVLYQWKKSVPGKSFLWAYGEMLRGRQPPPICRPNRRIEQATYTGTSSTSTARPRSDVFQDLEAKIDTEMPDNHSATDLSSSTYENMRKSFTQPVEVAEIHRNRHIRASQMLRKSQLALWAQELSDEDDSSIHSNDGSQH